MAEDSDAVAHDPFEGGECLTCHAPHASANPGVLAEDQASICMECHDDIGEDLSAAVSVHAPLTDGDCTGCHNPHKSPLDSLLLAESPDLCLGCHEAVKEALETERVHDPAAEDCLNCHQPHLSSEAALINQPLQSLCAECHDTRTIHSPSLTST